MSALTPLGIVHTVVSLVALVAGVACLWREGVISSRSGLGKTYLATTAVTAATALGIFQHGGFGPPHALAIMTLIALSIGLAAERSAGASRAWAIVMTASFSVTLLFHMIPAVTESLTRLPAAAPVAASADAPIFPPLYLALFIAYGVGLAWQLRQLPKR